MKILSFIINGVVVLCVGTELVMILFGGITADQLLVSSSVSGLLILVSVKLLKDALAHLYGLTESQKEVIKNELNIMDTINAHIKWKISLQKYLDGSTEERFDPELIGRDDQCALGRWIHGSALNYFTENEGIKLLRDKHAQLHVIAGDLVKKFQANDRAAASKLMANDFKTASHNVVQALTELNQLVMTK